MPGHADQLRRSTSRRACGDALSGGSSNGLLDLREAILLCDSSDLSFPDLQQTVLSRYELEIHVGDGRAVYANRPLPKQTAGLAGGCGELKLLQQFADPGLLA